MTNNDTLKEIQFHKTNTPSWKVYGEAEGHQKLNIRTHTKAKYLDIYLTETCEGEKRDVVRTNHITLEKQDMLKLYRFLKQLTLEN